jgi:glycosyltransferase involved in cell wall biosynthesis
MKIGLFGDHPDMPTGMAIVLKNLALGLSFINPQLDIYFFGRFGQQSGFSKEPVVHEDGMYYHLVNCEGGVWKTRMTVDAINHYGLDCVITEDDWFSIGGMMKAVRHTKVPFHFITPIDSLPIHAMAQNIFKECTKVYVPNSAYKMVKSHNSLFLPHGVRSDLFYPEKTERDDLFTFIWVGRDEPRKAMGRFILAFQEVCKKVPCQAIIHSDWRADMAVRTARYIRHKRDLPIIMTQMEGGTHSNLRKLYNKADVLVCTSKAGAFEMSIVEAMACGVCPIITDWTFMNEIPVRDENGFLVPIKNVCEDYVKLGNGKVWGIPIGRKWGNINIKLLASKMVECVKNLDKTKSMGESARYHIKQNYDWNKIAGKLMGEIE